MIQKGVTLCLKGQLIFPSPRLKQHLADGAARITLPQSVRFEILPSNAFLHSERLKYHRVFEAIERFQLSEYQLAFE